MIEVSSDNNSVTIPTLLQQVADEICDKYCKWPVLWDAEKEGCDLSESDICMNCPLTRLI